MAICQFCKNEFEPQRTTKGKYCSVRCACLSRNYNAEVHEKSSKTRASKLSDRFWSRVDKTNTCWNWIGTKGPTGYGYISVKHKNTRAHRLSWTFVHGPIAEDLCVCHKCDNPSCVNPDHLFLGSNLENRRDSASKGRVPKGERSGVRLHPETVAKGENHGCAKLTDKQVLQIRSLHSRHTKSCSELAKDYQVSPDTIRLIVSKKTWKHLEMVNG
jgi:hypothetical protein